MFKRTNDGTIGSTSMFALILVTSIVAILKA